MKNVFLGFIILFGLIIAIFTLAFILYPYFTVSAMVSISEAPSYYNYQFDPKQVKTLPGSLALIITSESPFFSINLNYPQFFKVIGLWLLILSIFSVIIATIFSLTAQTFKEIIYAFMFIFIAAGLIVLSGILMAPATKGDILCYSKWIEQYKTPFVICHTLIGEDKDNVILFRHRDNATEIVPKNNVVGKVVYIAQPPFGIFLSVLKLTSEAVIKLYDIIARGYIPLKIDLVYIETY